jgi:hypothetical protein
MLSGMPVLIIAHFTLCMKDFALWVVQNHSSNVKCKFENEITLPAIDNFVEYSNKEQ